MRFDDPAWRATPIRTALRVAKSLVRRKLPAFRLVAVPFDAGRASIYADLGTPLGLRLYRYRYHDPDLELLARLLGPGDVFVDGGANVGLFTLVAASRVGPSGKVIAFEPARDVRMRLSANVVLNRFGQVEIMPQALSAQAGEASFRVFDAAGAGLNHLAPADGEAGALETVALTTLDLAVTASDRARVALIKLDLEGAEHAALQGASALLAARHPDLLVEIEPAHLARMGSSPAAVSAHLTALGYHFYRVGTAPAGTPLLRPAPDITAPSPHPNVFATVDPDRARAHGVELVGE